VNKVSGILGLAHRAKKILVGETEVTYGIYRGQVVGVVLADDLAAGQKRKFENLVKEYDILSVNWGTKEEIGIILNRRPTGILGFQDTGFWQKFLHEIGYDQGVN